MVNQRGESEKCISLVDLADFVRGAWLTNPVYRKEYRKCGLRLLQGYSSGLTDHAVYVNSGRL